MKPKLAALLLLTVVGNAQTVPDPDLPAAFDPQSVSGLIANSPFIRSVNLSDSLILTGLAYIETKPVVTLLDTATNRHHVVSEEPNALGWKLTEASSNNDLNRAQAKVSIGGEIITIRYNADALTPENLKKKKDKGSANGPPPGDGGGDRYRKPEGRGPSEEDRRRYEALSDGAKEKMRNFFRENMDRIRSAGNDEERRQFIRGAFEKIEKEDKAKK
jgi:hypothetical protein